MGGTSSDLSGYPRFQLNDTEVVRQGWPDEAPADDAAGDDAAPSKGRGAAGGVSVRVRRGGAERSDLGYEVELSGPGGIVEVHTTSSLRDLEALWAGLRHIYPEAEMPALMPEMAPRDDHLELNVDVPPTAPPWAELVGPEFHRWHREYVEDCRESLVFRARPLMETTPTRSCVDMWSTPGDLGLTMVADCIPPLLADIMGFIAGSPKDLATFSALTSRLVAVQSDFAAREAWKNLYNRTWPGFAQCLRFHGVQDWQLAYKETISGRREFIMEVFEREKKLGFTMSAMAARVRYDAGADAYVAKYISASEVRPEVIPLSDGRRLRFCPESARASLRPGLPDAGSAQEASGRQDEDNALAPASGGADAQVPQLPPYPHRVMPGLDGLRVGVGVELQWKMQVGSPFGWWYATLEDLRCDPGADTAVAVLAFTHFAETSQWHRLQVRFGDGEMRPCIFGGLTGGIRSVTGAEREEWMRYFPAQPIEL